MPKSIFRLPERPDNFVEKEVDRTKIIRNICFFGDSSVPQDSFLYKQAWITARALAEKGYAIVDGGGPGVMKAATDGAESVGGHTVAVYWEPKLASIFEGRNLSNVTDETEAYSNYMMRTMGLIEKSHVYIVCQGGTGTISELGMVWALAKLYYGKHKPVILFGEFWPELIKSVQKAMLIDDNELAVLHYATTTQEVVDLINTFEIEVESRARRTYEGDETAFVLAPRYDEEYVKKMREMQQTLKYQVRNAVTEKQLEEFKELVKSPARVLEVGSGGGFDTTYLSKFYSVVSLETNPELIEIARFENPNADILQADIREYEVQENVFKGIWTRDELHHIPGAELPGVFAKLAKGLVAGGVMYAIVRAGEGEGMEPDVLAGKRIEQFYHYFTQDELETLGRDAGLEVVRIDRMTRSHEWMAAIFRKPEA